MPDVYLGLGTNLGEKEENLYSAVKMIKERIGEITSLSSFYETAPWGFVSDNSFINAVVQIRTSLSPIQVLKATQLIEKEMGRAIKTGTDGTYSDRIIDIDILLYDDLILNCEELTLPHPLMTERSFVMEPLAEIAPDLLHPVLGKTIKELAGVL